MDTPAHPLGAHDLRAALHDRPEDPAADRRADLTTLLTATGLIGGTTAAGAALQTGWAYAHAGAQLPDVTSGRMLANFAGVAAGLAVLTLLRMHLPMRSSVRLARLLVMGLAASAVRLVVLLLLHAPPYGVAGRTVEELAGALVLIVCATVGLAATDVQRRLRQRGVELVHRTQQAAAALAALSEEEMRIRRSVAEGLHGTAQQRLAIAVRTLDQVAAAPDGEVAPHWRTVLAGLRDELDDVRATDVRSLSRLLYPEHLDIGLVPAVRALVRLIPAATAVDLQVDPAVVALDDPAALGTTDAERLLAVRVVEEAVTNAVRHSDAPHLTVHLGATAEALVVEVQDDGAGFDASSTERSGLGRLAERLEIAGGSLEVTSSPGAGARIRGVVPLSGRHPSPSPLPPARATA